MKLRYALANGLMIAGLLWGSCPAAHGQQAWRKFERKTNFSRNTPLLNDVLEKVPSDWTKATTTHVLKTGERMQSTLIAPPGAEQANIDGWLSYGFRVTFIEPREGSRYVMGNAHEQMVERMTAVAKEYDDVTVIAEKEVRVGEAVGHLAVVAGTRKDKLSEPELAGLLMLQGPEGRVTMEIAAPLSERETFLEMLKPLAAMADE